MARDPGLRKIAARSSFYCVHSNLRFDTYCWKTHLQNIQAKKQETLIRILIQAIEKGVHLSFTPSITRLPLGRALMTTLK